MRHPRQDHHRYVVITRPGFSPGRPGHTTAIKTTIVTVGAVAAAAAIGGIAADPGSAWYHSLRKPRWQPPSPAYALVWTPLYVTIAYAAARALTCAQSRDRSQLAARC
jgi:tryptophan-rich sensory protein